MIMKNREVKIGVVGLGYWGPKLVETFGKIKEARVSVLCDLNPELLSGVSQSTGIPGTASFRGMLHDASLAPDAVVIATPPRTHFSLALEALEYGKHVFVEKPLTTSLIQAEQLTVLAQKRGLVLFVDHTFCFDKVFEALQRMVRGGEFGYLESSKFEWLGARPKPQGPDVLWDSGPHAFSALYYLLGKLPCRVSARPLAFLPSGVLSALSARAEFDDGTAGEIFLAWKDQIILGKDVEKAARVTLQGAKREITYEGSFGKRQALCSEGGRSFPLPGVTYEDEPLRSACEAFVRAVADGKPAVTDGAFGGSIVRILETAERSVREGGSAISLI